MERNGHTYLQPSRLVAAAAFLAVSVAASAAPPLPGAIFTTNSSGIRVNANIYSAKCGDLGVYLDGGPGITAPTTAAGLPDGDYYFQVTDPSGKTLLSTDPVANRQIHVSGGVIVSVSGLGNHPVRTDTDGASVGAVVVELCPFLDTPNNGGEYKVWVTPVGDFKGNPAIADNGYSPGYFHGFIPAASKTDNFKVKARTAGPCLTIRKVEDIDGDGKIDPYEEDISWPVWITDANGALVQGYLYTGLGSNKTPELKICNLAPGTYTVEEALQAPWDGATWTPTANILDGKFLSPPSNKVLVTIRSSDRTLIFLNKR